MPRPECPLDPAAGPAAQFAHDLRELRRRAGSPTYREMQAKSYVSYSSLSRAAGGRKFPTWAVTEGFVKACGGDLLEWKQRWRDTARLVGAAPDWLSRAASFPDPTAVHTVEQFRAAVGLMCEGLDPEAVSAAMSAPRSVVRLVSGWPEQVDPATFRCFVRACGGGPVDEERWAATRLVVLTDQRQQPRFLPNPESIHQPHQMHAAVETMLAATSVPAVAARMHTNPGTVGRVLIGVDRVDADLFGRFVLACGVARTDVDAWIDARRRVIEARERLRNAPHPPPRQDPPTPAAGPPTTGPTAAGPATAGGPDRGPTSAPASTSPSCSTSPSAGAFSSASASAEAATARVVTLAEPAADLASAVEPGEPVPLVNPDDARSYDELLAAVQALKCLVGVTCADIERISDGRLGRHDAAAILDGVVPASGEQLVLLLRALGLRSEVGRWVGAWCRLDGAHLGKTLLIGQDVAAAVAVTAHRVLPVAVLVFLIVTVAVLAWLV